MYDDISTPHCSTSNLGFIPNKGTQSNNNNNNNNNAKTMVKSKELKVMRKKIDKADKLPDPLSVVKTVPTNLAFALTTMSSQQQQQQQDKDDTNHNDNNKTTTLHLESVSSANMNQQVLQDCLQMFQDNMGDLYRGSSWGLDLEDKAKEFGHAKARFLLVVNNNNNNTIHDDNKTLAAFCHYRFDWDDDQRPEYPVLYVYELQVAPTFQRRHVGHGLQVVLEEIGRQTGMTKIMLTVFNKNVRALEFYRQKCGYDKDESDPSNYQQYADYMILSKSLL